MSPYWMTVDHFLVPTYRYEEGDTIMKSYPQRYMLTLIVLLFLLLISVNTNVLAEGGETVYITSPAEGESLVGVITITGAVGFQDFQKYELFLKTGDEMLWAATIYAPVINGNLARLDTRIFPDGAYQLIVRQVRTDSNYTEFVGPNFFIENNLGAPLPYPEVEANFLYPPEAGALIRVRNCSGDNLEFDYNSPEGFCSSDKIWIPFKHAESTYCPFADILLKPCEYRGTVRGQGTSAVANYGFVAEAGKIYELTYPGGSKFYLGQVEGDDRAETDIGDLDPNDPARLQLPAAVEDDKSVEVSSAVAEASISSQVTTGPEVTTSSYVSDETPAEVEVMLPVSGRGTEVDMTFVIAAVGLILLLIVGGVVATRKRGYPA